jgi:hypothetical protein
MIKCKNTNPVKEHCELFHGEHFAHLALLMGNNLRISVVVGEPQGLIWHSNCFFDGVPNIKA